MALGDDGTLDTVFYCSDCPTEVRYTFTLDVEALDTGAYPRFIEESRRDAIDNHVCIPRMAPASRFTT